MPLSLCLSSGRSAPLRAWCGRRESLGGVEWPRRAVRVLVSRAVVFLNCDFWKRGAGRRTCAIGLARCQWQTLELSLNALRPWEMEGQNSWLLPSGAADVHARENGDDIVMLPCMG